MDNELIFKCYFGSHLYGTANKSSDSDFKGIFLPSQEQVLLGKIPKSINNSTKKGDGKNTSEDIDIEFYSLNYFIHLACEGETVALDMLHAPNNMILESSEIWLKIIEQREKFYTSNLKAFVGYARRQAAKYGIKGSRLNDAKRVLKFFNEYVEEARLSIVWDDLPDGEHIHKIEAGTDDIRHYQICGRKIPETATINYAYSIVDNFYQNYGKRAQAAAMNEGVDWKAVSHALRAAYQVKEILIDNMITFPLKEALYLKEVKEGKRHYSDEVAPKLDALISEVEILSKESKLPLKVDRKYWDKFIMQTLRRYCFDLY